MKLNNLVTNDTRLDLSKNTIKYRNLRFFLLINIMDNEKGLFTLSQLVYSN